MRILTFDIEEWFHLLDHASTESEKQWEAFPVRIYENTDRIFDILKPRRQRATFFVIGWVARQYPEVVKRIHASGHDIGFHTDMHSLIHRQTPGQFREDLRAGTGHIEQLTGEKVRSFRAPGFSLTESCNWAFDILAEAGIEYDSSVFPAGHAHGGYPSFPSAGPALIRTDCGDIKEFPINAGTLLGRKIIYSGGGYFRLLPYSVIRSCTAKDDYVMSYLHPRDMDSGQPVIKDLPLPRRFKSYVGIRGARAKLERWLDEFEFTDMRSAASEVDWDNVPVVDLRRKA